MSREEAVYLIKSLIDAEVECVKQVNTGRGHVSKKVQQQEYLAIRAIFKALTGSEMAPAEMEMVQP